MTFSTRMKEEITKQTMNRMDIQNELSAIIRYDAKLTKNNITLSFENAAVAQRVYKDFKELFNVSIHIIVRNQKRFRMKQIYILEIKEKVEEILESLLIYQNGKKVDMKEDYLPNKEDQISYIKGAFLVTGSINDPRTSGYHLEFVFMTKKNALFVQKILTNLSLDAKVLKRSNRYMVYIKSAEMISDLMKAFETTGALFYFEDIRIYRDHKNMVNRLNNCEIANQEKTTTTGLKQIKCIAELKKYNLIDLLDEKTKIVLEYREKYPESSYYELAEIITLETGYKIGKSGINHHFIKMKQLLESYHLQNNKNS
ncbi:MAG: DNA-binding protein WhiA [Bacilli bacterium]|nr:DNA-binding protein WhiA [Bacilli bacterium]